MNTSSLAQRNEKIVRDFLAAWSQRSGEVLMPYFAPNIVYQNMPWPVIEGAAGVRGFADAFFPMTDRVRFDILHLLASDRLVFTERVDHFLLKTGAKIALPVNGIFEVNEAGQFTAWRDYFDLQSWLSQGGPAL